MNIANFKGLKCLHTYNNPNRPMALCRNQYLWFDDCLNIQRKTQLSYESLVISQSSSDGFSSDVQDYHAVLLKEKIYICDRGAIYCLGNNFHKIVNVPELIDSDCSQNLALCGNKLIVSNRKNQFFIVDPDNKSTCELSLQLQSGERYHHIFGFADRCYICCESLCQLYYLCPLNYELILLHQAPSLSSFLDQGGLIVLDSSDQTAVIDCTDNSVVVIGDDVSKECFSFFSFKQYFEISYLGLQYKEELIQDYLPQFNNFLFRRALIWFQYIKREGSPTMIENLMGYSKFNEDEKRALCEVFQQILR